MDLNDQCIRCLAPGPHKQAKYRSEEVPGPLIRKTVDDPVRRRRYDYYVRGRPTYRPVYEGALCDRCSFFEGVFGNAYRQFDRREWWMFWTLPGVEDIWPSRRRRWAMTLTYLRGRFDAWAALPGDVFYEIQSDIYCVVHRPLRGSRAVCERVSGQLWMHRRPNGSWPHGVIPAYDEVDLQTMRRQERVWR